MVEQQVIVSMVMEQTMLEELTLPKAHRLHTQAIAHGTTIGGRSLHSHGAGQAIVHGTTFGGRSLHGHGAEISE